MKFFNSINTPTITITEYENKRVYTQLFSDELSREYYELQSFGEVKSLYEELPIRPQGLTWAYYSYYDPIEIRPIKYVHINEVRVDDKGRIICGASE
jgi:hypothetical protein